MQSLRSRPRSTRLDYADKLSLQLDPWQQDVLRSEHRQILLNVTRQGGKSTISSIAGLTQILSADDQLVLVVSPGERQSKLLFEKLLRYYEQLGRPVPAKTVNKLSLELVNGSSVYALPGEEGTIRGFSAVDLMLIDEASRVNDAMMAAVRPMLAVSGGQLIAMSTPWGKRGWWYDAWVSEDQDWHRFEVNAYQCPRIPRDWLENERRVLPPAWFESEFMCKFVEPDDALFTEEQIARAFQPSEVEPLFQLGEVEALFPIGG